MTRELPIEVTKLPIVTDIGKTSLGKYTVLISCALLVKEVTEPDRDLPNVDHTITPVNTQTGYN
jgi:hypothetical protein